MIEWIGRGEPGGRESDGEIQTRAAALSRLLPEPSYRAETMGGTWEGPGMGEIQEDWISQAFREIRKGVGSLGGPLNSETCSCVTGDLRALRHLPEWSNPVSPRLTQNPSGQRVAAGLPVPWEGELLPTSLP